VVLLAINAVYKTGVAFTVSKHWISPLPLLRHCVFLSARPPEDLGIKVLQFRFRDIT